MSSVVEIDKLNLSELPACGIYRRRIRLVEDARGESITIPLLIARGENDGPTLGLTAAVHGDELNGLRVIHKLFSEIEPKELKGNIIAVPVVNIPGFLEETRSFNDGNDLNRLMPGRIDGNCAEVYAYRFVNRVVKHFDYLIDLHTASVGRVNSLYVRANLEHPETAWMARAQHPRTILHNPSGDGTLRGAAMDLGIPAITVEVGDPMRFQSKMIRYGFLGVANVLSHLKMVDIDEDLPSFEPKICDRSKWLYTDTGGILRVLVNLNDEVRKGQKLAEVTDLFGQVTREHFAPYDGIVIGHSRNPVNQTGSRIVHLGEIQST